MYKIVQNRYNLKVNPEVAKASFSQMENQTMEESYGWEQWEYFLENERSGDFPEEYMKEMQEDIVASIYGQGGGHRYHIMGNGDVIFSEMHALDEGKDRANKLGFTMK